MPNIIGNEQNVCVLFVSCAGFWRLEAAYFLAKSVRILAERL